MGNLIDLTGRKYGRLLVIRRAGTNRRGVPTWLCKCDCGNEHIAAGDNLKSGNTKSCGCLQPEIATKHGKKNSRLYRIFRDMKQRCYNPNKKEYMNYGGRGITVCEEWRNSFEAFYEWAMANGYSDNLTIDRIDVNGNYEPSNCRWATHKEQANNKRNNNYVTYNGETHTITEWSEKLGVNYKTLKDRLKRNQWDMKRALEI